MSGREMGDKLKFFLMQNAVPIIFIVFSAFAIPLSNFSAGHLIQEMLIRLSRNSFLVLSLLIPIMAGMGLNFGMVLGAMAGQIGLIFVTDWGIVGIPGMITAAVLGTPIAILLGFVCGAVLNRAKGREMVTSYILGFFINGLYQFVVMYTMGYLIPIKNPLILLSRGWGVRSSIDLAGTRGVLDRLIDVQLWGIRVPVATYAVVVVFCLMIIWFRRTKLGQDMRATGQDMAVASSSGIPVERTRVVAIIISTILACYGQIIFLQNIGIMNTYNAHEQAGMFAIASLLVGGATVSRARISNVFLGVLLFHMMFVVSPNAGKTLMGQAQLGEYFRVCVSYGIIAVALVLHSMRRNRERERARRDFRLDRMRRAGR
ncbi:MAG: ABC transporter permease [Synergistaceae bacterium]|jgi:simple sugar transport system permease protein|nr:ABC transporter permease [Synergistaceae bacterium]